MWRGHDVGTLRSEWGVPELHVLAETGSTNDDARALAEEGCPSGCIVIAERQTAGRGRRGRSWFGTRGQSLHFSMVIRAPAHGFDCFSAAPVRVGLLVLRAISEFAGLDPRLKWPNDLLLEGRKTGGILCESVLGEEPFLVVGIGVNVAQSKTDFPHELQRLATSLSIAAGRTIDLVDTGAAVARQLHTAEQGIAEPLDDTELAELHERDALLGHAVGVDGRPAGTALGISREGALLVRSPSGVSEIRSGTVRLVGAIS
jgi:BirA family biotin operon repressor/biotin-[acetyl-CoA-carboxylase] ligase